MAFLADGSLSGHVELAADQQALTRSWCGCDDFPLAHAACARGRRCDQHHESVDGVCLWLVWRTRLVPSRFERDEENREPVHPAVCRVVRHWIACLQSWN